MKITIEKLEEIGACKSGADWFRATHPEGIEHDELVMQLMEEHLDWAYWLISRLLTPEQTAKWADYSATIAADAAARYAADAAAVGFAADAADAAANASYAATDSAAAARYAADRYAADAATDAAAATARYAAYGYADTAAAHAANAARYADSAAAASRDKRRSLIIKKGLDLIMEEQR